MSLHDIAANVSAAGQPSAARLGGMVFNVICVSAYRSAKLDDGALEPDCPISPGRIDLQPVFATLFRVFKMPHSGRKLIRSTAIDIVFCRLRSAQRSAVVR